MCVYVMHPSCAQQDQTVHSASALRTHPHGMAARPQVDGLAREAQYRHASSSQGSCYLRQDAAAEVTSRAVRQEHAAAAGLGAGRREVEQPR